jgi:hypothetical protein
MTDDKSDRRGARLACEADFERSVSWNISIGKYRRNWLFSGASGMAQPLALTSRGSASFRGRGKALLGSDRVGLASEAALHGYPADRVALYFMYCL